MVGITEISAGLSSLKTAFDIAQGLNAAAKEASINEVKLKLGQYIVDAQAALAAASVAQSDAAEEIRQLKQEIMRLKDWSAEKERYELKRYNPGVFAYTLKPSMDSSEPSHHLCTNCYQNDKRSILQATARSEHRYRIHRCHSCNSEMPLGAETTAESEAAISSDQPPKVVRQSGWVQARKGG